MQYERAADGSMTPLPKLCVDTGMGLERMAAVLQGVRSNYEIDIFQAIMRAADRETGASDHEDNSLKVIADHIGAWTFLIIYGVMSGNDVLTNVLCRISRRDLRHGQKL